MECYTGPPSTQGIGTCKAGAQTCSDDGASWGPCQGEILPSSEACDELDNDCDGAVDNGNPGGGAMCDTGQPGVCAAGILTCKDGSLACAPEIAPSPEACDNLDNDCDGQSDDEDPGGGMSCDTGALGVCAAGTTACNSGVIECIQSEQPAPEDCATPEDEDCDGVSTCPGFHLWSKGFGALNHQLAYAMAVDSAGNAVVAGYFRNVIDFGGGLLVSAGAQDIFVVKLDQAGNHVYSRRFGGTDADLALDVAVDAAGNALVTGETQSSAVDFGGGPLPGDAILDAFVLKLDAAGNHVFSKRWSGPGTLEGNGITTDGAGNAIATGYTLGTADFGGGPLPGAGAADLYMVKLGPNGDHLWSKLFGDAAGQGGQDIAADTAGNIVVTGAFEGVLDFGGGALVAQNSTDIFVAKLNAAGGHVFSKRFGGPPTQYGGTVALDSGGNTLLAGSFWGTLDFGGGPLTSAGSNDTYLVKLDAAGNHVWSTGFGDTGNDVGSDVSLDGADNVLLTGHFMGTVDFGGGPLTSTGGELDAYVLKLSPSGAHLWSKAFGGAGYQTGHGIGADAAGNVLVAGGFQGSIDFGGGALQSADGYDVFVAKIGP